MRARRPRASPAGPGRADRTAPRPTARTSTATLAQELRVFDLPRPGVPVGRDPVDEDLEPVAFHLGERRQGPRRRAEPRHRRVQLVVASPTRAPPARTRCPRAPRTASGPRPAACPLPAEPSKTRTTPPGSTTRTVSASASGHRGSGGGPTEGRRRRTRRSSERHAASRLPARAGTGAAARLLHELRPASATTDPSRPPGCRLREAAGRPARSRRRPRDAGRGRRAPRRAAPSGARRPVGKYRGSQS